MPGLSTTLETLVILMLYDEEQLPTFEDSIYIFRTLFNEILITCLVRYISNESPIMEMCLYIDVGVYI